MEAKSLFSHKNPMVSFLHALCKTALGGILLSIGHGSPKPVYGRIYEEDHHVSVSRFRDDFNRSP